MNAKDISQVSNDLVVTIEYELTVDDEVIDTSEDEGPLTYLHGHDNILAGLEDELLGMKIGDSKNLMIDPDEGYGEYSEDAFMDVGRDEFTDDIPLEIGTGLHLTDLEGVEAYATIVGLGKETVKLDFNHPLAGKELNFMVKVIDIRAASKEEIAHGHPHFEDEPD